MDEIEKEPRSTARRAGQSHGDSGRHQAQLPGAAGGRVVPAWRDPSGWSGLVVGRLLSGAGSWAAGALWRLVTEQLPGDRK
ncbi:hypothetical protein [Kitasatospora sp. NPDC085879]|uniref:hypothetical protein n=1 Tax=Kitasatospora sp. NPDC085879 TaxID=3154769 RepID=UPI000BB1163D|nr:hypothetical protein [Streptomyces sp. TLI_235]PBC69824.1 hypothetical protein BX265_7182 [Streptomyces sp. TLI_235]